MAFISKIKLAGEQEARIIKDSTAREQIETLLGSHALKALGTAAWAAVAAGVSDNNGNLPTAAQVKDYVDSAVAAIPEFDVVVVGQGEDLPTASKDTFHKIYLKAATSPSASNLYIEYITVRSGSAYTWEQIGDTALDLSGYVQKTTTIATIALDHNITAVELKNALGLKKLAYKDSATGSATLNTIDSIAVDEVTVAGNATVTYTSTKAGLTKGDYTPAGSITGSAISDGSIEVTLADAASKTSADITASSYTPQGSVSKPSISVDPTTDTIQPVSNVGTAASLEAGFFTAGSAASFKEGAFTPATLGDPTKSSFAIQGIVANVGSGDDSETLILTTAETAQAVTAQGTFTGGSKAPDTFVANTPALVDVTKFNGGSTPTLGTAKAFMTAATAELDNAPVFTGTPEADMKVTKVEYYKQVVDDAEFTGVAASLGFSGTEQKQLFVTDVTYDKANPAAAFSEKVTPTISPAGITRTAKTINITVE